MCGELWLQRATGRQGSEDDGTGQRIHGELVVGIRAKLASGDGPLESSTGERLIGRHEPPSDLVQLGFPSLDPGIPTDPGGDRVPRQFDEPSQVGDDRIPRGTRRQYQSRHRQAERPSRSWSWRNSILLDRLS